MENLCRTCLNASVQLFPLFADMKLVTAIETISSIQMIEMKNFPNRICEECINNINFFLMFQQTVTNSDKEIRRRLSEEVLKSGCETLDTKETNDANQNNTSISFDDDNTKLFSSNDNVKVNENNKHVNSITDSLLEENYNIHFEQIKIEIASVDENTQNTVKLKLDSTDNNVKRKVPTRVCNICGKSITYYNIGSHIKSHSDIPAKCEVCGKVCKNAIALRYHLYVHKREEMHCHICGRIYKCRKHFKTHMAKHDNIEQPRNYKCSVCEKAFHINGTLVKHMRSHTGERPYVCEFCGKGFTSTNALKTHRRQHTNERPYKCELCEMAFPQKVSLVTHVRSKHSEQNKK